MDNSAHARDAREQGAHSVPCERFAAYCGREMEMCPAGIRLLCDAARENGIPVLYDNIAADNPSYRLFLKNGFEIDSQDGDGIMVKKTISYQEINAKTIDRWVKEDWEWGRPIDHDTYEAARNGIWDVKLTPVKYVPHEWFGELKGKKILGLASGGGQQMPVFSALGAICTVLDYSEEQLRSERLVAEREQYHIEMIRADMTKRLPFADGSFDLIFHPVSNCYVQEVKPIWRECCRILKPSGILLAGLDNGMNFLFAGDDETKVVNALPFDPIKNPEQMKQLQEDDCGVQFSHTLEEQIGGQLEAGFRLTALYEDTNGAGRLHEMNIPCFLATRAVK